MLVVLDVGVLIAFVVLASGSLLFQLRVSAFGVHLPSLVSVFASRRRRQLLVMAAMP